MNLRMIYAGLLILSLSMPVLLYMQLEVGEKLRDMEPPTLPEMTVGDDGELLQTVLTQVLWDENRGVIKDDRQEISKVEAQIDTSWKLMAISNVGENAIAVVRVGDEIQRIKQGEAFPDGAVLLEVSQNSIKFERDDVILNGYLFGKKPRGKNENEND